MELRTGGCFLTCDKREVGLGRLVDGRLELKEKNLELNLWIYGHAGIDVLICCTRF